MLVHGLCYYRAGMPNIYEQKEWHKLPWWADNNQDERFAEEYGVSLMLKISRVNLFKDSSHFIIDNTSECYLIKTSSGQ